MIVERPEDRLTNIIVPEYQNSPNYIKYLNIFAEQHNIIHIALEDTEVKRRFDEAEGHQLDTIGYIVGLERGVFQALDGIFFGFLGSIGSGTFGTTSDEDIGAVFLSEGQLEVSYETLDDESYRRRIESKIIVNHKRMTVENIISIVQKITGLENVEITEDHLTFNVHLPYSLDDDTKLLLISDAVIPKPLGVGMTISDINGSFS
jgi:hypothetical protein